MEEQYDVVIVGAGLAGSSLAGALAAVSDKRIAVLELSLPEAIVSPSAQSRPICLNYGSQQALATLGWWTGLQSHAAPIQSVQVSQQGRMGVVNFVAEELGVPALGYVIPYDYLHQQLYQVTAGSAQVDFIQVSGIESIANQSAGTTLTVRRGVERQELCARLLVVADGANSDCCELLGIRAQKEDQEAVAVSGELMLASPHQGKALQRFTQQGVIAILPLADPQRVRFVLSLSAEQHGVMSTWGRVRWLRFWQQALRGYLLVDSVKVGDKFPLQIQMATEVVRPGVVIMGNAAHTIYPLAAQGFNLTWRDVAALVELLVAAINDTPSDWAGMAVLQRYVQWRQTDAQQLKQFTSGLQSLFQLRLPILGHLRGLGLMALDALPAGKSRLGRWLMGMGGKVPQLMRSVLPTQYATFGEVRHD